MPQLHKSNLNVETPAIYRIRVQGNLDSTWSTRLSDLQITVNQNTKGHAETLLVGRLPDQAALTGVLNTLYELHLPVLLVECLEKLD